MQQDVYVVSHCQSQHHVDKRVGGWYDSELTALGRQQALRVAESLRQKILGDDVALYSSDLLRASQTADVIGQHFAKPVQLDRRLREISAGVQEGMPQAQHLEQIVPPSHDAAAAECLDYRVCEGAESRRDIAHRISEVMAEISQQPSQTKIIVSHGFALTFIVLAWLRIPVKAQAFANLGSSAGAITHLTQGGLFPTNRSLQVLSDSSHLEGL